MAQYVPGLRRPSSPSLREPQHSWHNNQADLIERQMEANGHQTWGYVIYRTTYENESEWTEFLSRLRSQLESTFDSCNGRDILDRFTLTIFSDESEFARADIPRIRDHFKQWSAQASSVEQQANVGRSDRPDLFWMGPSARYQFCVLVDNESLHSIIHEAPQDPARDATKRGWVKLISKTWIPLEDDPNARGGHDEYEPIDGITERDVGWMKVPYLLVMTEYYSGNEGMNGWWTEYCRPPKVVGWPYDE